MASACPTAATLRNATPAGPGPHRRDQRLAGRVAAGDGPAFDELYRRYGRRVYAFALKRLQNPADAEDVTQEVFFQVCRSIHRYAGRSSLMTWMFGIAHHETCNHLRRRMPPLASLEEAEAMEIASSQPSADRCVDATRALARCCSVLEARVSASQREIFDLRYGENQPVSAIAAKLGKTSHAVKIGLFRTRRALAQTPGVEQVLGS